MLSMQRKGEHGTKMPSKPKEKPKKVQQIPVRRKESIHIMG